MNSQKQPAREMTDLEMTKLCAEAMGLRVVEQLGELRFSNTPFEESLYDPLHDDAQAMALMKRFSLHTDHDGKQWHVCISGVYYMEHGTYAAYLNRAIVECVAKMQRDVSVRGSDNATPK